MKIGFFCGTFDPVHLGHLRVALHVFEEFNLDRLFFLPAGLPPNKAVNVISPSSLRLEMISLAIAPWPILGVSTVETDRVGLSYMVDTVKILKSQNPDSELFLLLGEDNLAVLNTWKEWKAILDEVSLIVFRKDCSSFTLHPDLNSFQSKIFRSSAPVLDISSTDIRNRIKTGKNTDLLLPDQVQNFIINNGLYKN